jgi:hypothetical protein
MGTDTTSVPGDEGRVHATAPAEGADEAAAPDEPDVRHHASEPADGEDPSR